MKKYIYILLFFVLYFSGALLHQYQSEITKATYHNAIIPQLIVSTCAIILGILLSLFLYECVNEMKQSKPILLITLIILGILAISPYLVFITYLMPFTNNLFYFLNRLIKFSPFACFSFGICLVAYIMKVKSLKSSKGPITHPI